MMTKSFILPTGAKLDVTVSDYSAAINLRKAILKTTLGIELPKNLLDMDVTSFKDFIAKAASSEEVEAALFKCADRATYDGVRVTRELFDDPAKMEKAREDHDTIFLKILEVNCAPFFVQLFSQLKTRPLKRAENQE